MSQNNNSQSKTKKQPPNNGKPPKTEFINSEQQPKTPKLSDIN